jgi:hypothetical protein
MPFAPLTAVGARCGAKSAPSSVPSFFERVFAHKCLIH